MGSEGGQGPTTLLATNLSEYSMNGVKLPTVIVIASGSDTWQIVSHVLFGDDWPVWGQ